MYPVEVRYRPVERRRARTRRATRRTQALADAVDELCARAAPGDVLVFLPGEREIREAADALRKHQPQRASRSCRCTRGCRAAEQDRVFKPRRRAPHRAGDQRRRDLADRAAASATWSTPASRASSATATATRSSSCTSSRSRRPRRSQRTGRCGRVGRRRLHPSVRRGGLRRRPAFTDPEILRSSLACVILRMKCLAPRRHRGLSLPRAAEPARDRRRLRSCSTSSARSTTANELTQIGRELARLPLDPRVGRMILAARDERLPRARCCIIAAALSVQDPRERPLERAAAADERTRAVRRRAVGLPRAPQAVEVLRGRARAQEVEPKLQSCRENFLSFRACASGATSTRSCRTLARSSSWPVLGNAGEAGRLSSDPPRAARRPARQRRPARRRRANYTRRARHQVLDPSRVVGEEGRAAGSWRRSSSRRRGFTRAASRASSRAGSRRSAAHLLKRSRYDPHWEKRRGEVVGARARHAVRPADLHEPARALRPDRPGRRARSSSAQALVQGDWRRARRSSRTTGRLVARDRAARAQVAPPGHPGRRGADPRLLRRARSRRQSTTAQAFEAWRAEAERRSRSCCILSREDLMRHEAAGITTENFPPPARARAEPLRARVPLRAGLAARRRDDDGAARAAQPGPGSAHASGWCPGLLKEKVRALAKSHAAAAAPQARRARRLRRRVHAPRCSRRHCRSPKRSRAMCAREFNLDVPLDAFRPDSRAAAPAHELPRARRRTGASSRWDATSPQLKRELGEETEAVLQEEAPVDEGERYTGWTMGDLPEIMEIERGGADARRLSGAGRRRRCASRCRCSIRRRRRASCIAPACGGCWPSRSATASATCERTLAQGRRARRR